MDEDPEAQENRAKVRSLLMKAAPSLAKIHDRSHAHGGEQIRFAQVVDLLRKQQALKKAQSNTQKRQAELNRKRTLPPGGPKDDRTLLQILCPTNHRALCSSLLDEYTEVRSWFYQSVQYTEWLKGRSWYLSCYGEPRCGKTTFTAAVAGNINERFQEDTDTVVITLFLGHLDRPSFQISGADSVLKLVLRATWRQLLERSIDSGMRPEILDRFSGYYMFQLTLDELRDKVYGELQKFKNVFLLVDGLDWLDEDATQNSVREEMLRMLDSTNSEVSLLRLMFIQTRTEMIEPIWIRCDRDCGRTVVLYWRCEQCHGGDFHLCRYCFDEEPSCLDPEHEALKEPYETVEMRIKPPSHELAAYLHQQFKHEKETHTTLGHLLDRADGILEKIETTIVNQSAGVFVLAKLYIDYLNRKHSLEDVLDVLDRLAEHEEEYFSSLMHEISSQPSGDKKKLAYASLAIAITAGREARYMSFDELADAIHDFGDPSVPRLTEHELLKITKGFLTIERNEFETVEPFHAKAGVYLYENCQDIFDTLRLDMVKLCLKSITNAERDWSAADYNSDDVYQYLRDHQFVRYSLQNWGKHITTLYSTETEDTALQILDLYDKSAFLQKATFLVSSCETDVSWPGNHKLHVAAWFGLMKVLDHLLAENPGLDVNARDSITGCTALHIACRQGYQEFAKRLLEAGADPWELDEGGDSAFADAVKSGRVEMVETILENCRHISGPALNAIYPVLEGRIALMHAIENCEDDMATVLLQLKDLDVNVQDEHGLTALHIAADLADPTMMELLTALDRFQCLSKMDHTIGEKSAGRTAGMMLLESESGTSLDALEKIQFIETCCKQDPSGFLHTLDKFGRSLLHYACINDSNAEVAKHLIQSGLSVDQKDKQGRTPLHFAALRNLTSETIRLLIAHGADLATEDDQGFTAYDIAKWRKLSSAEILKPASMKIRTPEEILPLWQLLTENPSEFYSRHKADLITLPTNLIIQKDPLLYTLLHLAVEARSPECLALLLKDPRLDPNALNADGQTALYLAIIYSDLECINLLIDHHAADLECINPQGQSALQKLMDQGLYDIAWKLIKRDEKSCLDLSQADKQALLHEAIETNEADLVRMLLRQKTNALRYRRANMSSWETARDDGAGEEIQGILREAEQEVLDKVKVA